MQTRGLLPTLEQTPAGVTEAVTNQTPPLTRSTADHLSPPQPPTYSDYFADPVGHLWQLAHNPHCWIGPKDTQLIDRPYRQISPSRALLSWCPESYTSTIKQTRAMKVLLATILLALLPLGAQADEPKAPTPNKPAEPAKATECPAACAKKATQPAKATPCPAACAEKSNQAAEAAKNRALQEAIMAAQAAKMANSTPRSSRRRVVLPPTTRPSPPKPPVAVPQTKPTTPNTSANNNATRVAEAQQSKAPTPPSRERRVVLPPKSKSSTASPRPGPPPSGAAPRPHPASARPSTTRPTSATRATNATAPPAPPKAAVPEQKQNITLRFSGSFHHDLDMDLELTGSGPIFSIDYPAPRGGDDDLPPAIVTISAALKQSGENYEVEYSVGARVAIKQSAAQRNSGNPVTHHIEFRDLALRGTVQLKPGEPITLAKQGGKKLSLTLIKGE